MLRGWLIKYVCRRITMKEYKDRFREVVLEYAHYDSMMHANAHSAKSHHKSIMRGGAGVRKHENNVRKQHTKMSPIVDSVSKTGSERMIGGKTLHNLLIQYNMKWAPGYIKNFSQGAVAIFMFTDTEGNSKGVVHQKSKSDKFKAHPSYKG